MSPVVDSTYNPSSLRGRGRGRGARKLGRPLGPNSAPNVGRGRGRGRGHGRGRGRPPKPKLIFTLSKQGLQELTQSGDPGGFSLESLDRSPSVTPKPDVSLEQDLGVQTNLIKTESIEENQVNVKFDSSSLFNNPDISDLTIHVVKQNDPETLPVVFHAHKFILAGASPIFKRMFVNPNGSECSGRKLVFSQTPADTIEDFLRLIYTGKPKTFISDPLSLMEFSIKYEIESLKHFAFPHALEQINKENFSIIYKMIEDLQIPEITAKAAAHFIRNKEWLISERSDLVKLLDCQELVMDIILNTTK